MTRPAADVAGLVLADYLPHGERFVLLDRVLEAVPDDSLRAERAVGADDPFLEGHFPGRPLYPGALLLEGLAQCCLVLFQLTHGRLAPGELGVFGAASGRFLGPVFPGDTLEYRVRAERMTPDGGVFEGRALVLGKVVARGELSMARARYDALRAGREGA